MTHYRESKREYLVRLISIAFFSAFLASCARDYVTGRPSFTMVDEVTELRLGAEEDGKVVSMFGVYEDDDLARFVNELGQKIVKVSHRPNIDYSFRILDSKVPNAFAAPGGYVYVTRGLLAYVNSTDELVGVLAHEVGHVAGRHSAEQISKQIVASGFGLLNAVSSVAPRLGGLLSAPSALLLLSYSRRQEKESDKLGVEYTTRLGYDARELARFLNLLKQISREDGRRMPTFLSTHPDSGDRAEKVMKLSEKWQADLNWKSRPIERTPYLQRIDGIVFGENPRQGYTADGYFYHPDLKFQFPYQEGWTVLNSRQAVLIVSPEEDALIQLTVESAPSPKSLADEMMGQSKLVIRESRAAEVGGLNAYIVESETQKRELRILSYFIQADDKVFVFHAMTPFERYIRRQSDFTYTLDGFEGISDPEILAKEPTRLHIKEVDSKISLRALLVESDVATENYRTIEQLNGKSLDDTLDIGELVKLIMKDELGAGANKTY